jgi:hypothetical protein
LKKLSLIIMELLKREKSKNSDNKKPPSELVKDEGKE